MDIELNIISNYWIVKDQKEQLTTRIKLEEEFWSMNCFGKALEKLQYKGLIHFSQDKCLSNDKSF